MPAEKKWMFGLLLPFLAVPAAAQQNPLCDVNFHSQAVLVGNSDYKQTFKVPYAQNDVEAISTFLQKRLCYRKGNIKILRNATFNEMRAWLGTTQNPRGRLWKRARKGRSNIFVFYSGHGVPDAETKKAFLLPIDTDPNDAAFGYGLDSLDGNLRALNAYIGPRRSVTLVLDACFSGRSAGGALQSHSGAIRPNLPSNTGILRFTASGAGQLAYWNDAKKLGLFTSVFLDGVSGEADKSEKGNRDGKVTGRELTAYIADEVSYRARSLLGKEQTPTVPDGDYLSWDITVGKPRPAAAVRSISDDYKLAASVNTTGAWEVFLKHHGGNKDSFHVGLARASLEKLFTAEKRAAAERQAAAERKAAAERQAAAERKAAAERQAAAEREAAAERKAAAEREAEARRRVEAKKRKEVKTASISSTEPETPAVTVTPDPALLDRAIQTELARIGCYTSSIDGKWAGEASVL